MAGLRIPRETIKRKYKCKGIHDELDRVENYCELNREKWLPTNGIQFLNEERFAENLLRELDENDEVAKLFSEYRPAVKPGSEADKFRNKSLARMGLLIDIRETKRKRWL